MPTPDTLDARPASREWTLLTDCRLKLGTATANGLRRNSLQVSKRQASKLLNELIDNWEVGGFDVDTEAQNRFELRGRSSTLAGKPDIIARRDDETVIVDAKTSQESPSHAVLVMIYLYAVPRALEQHRNVKLRGQVTYRDHTVRVPAEAVDDAFVQNLGALIRRISADEPARRVPRNRAGNPNSPQAVIFLTSITDVMMGS